MALTRDEIRFGYQYLLGREPESETLYAQWSKIENVQVFKRLLLKSDEGQVRLRSDLMTATQDPWIYSQRKSFCFMHLEKTGGTTFHKMFSKAFDADRVSPIHLTNLHNFTIAELGRYDLVSGHFDYAATSYIPRPRLKRISILRDPIERLISFYRFFNCHPATNNEGDLIDLAKRCDPIDFFCHPAVFRSPRFNNAYLRTFGSSLYGNIPTDESEKETDDAFEVAMARILSLDALGLTEQMERSVNVMLTQLGMDPPDKFQSVHRTDEFALKVNGFSKAREVRKTKELCDAIEPLVRFDKRLYSAAATEFERRLNAKSPA